MGDDTPAFLAVEPGYKNVLRFRLGLTWLFVAAVAMILDYSLLEQLGFGRILPVVVVIAAAAIVAIAPQRIYRRLRYRLTGQVLQVLRGWLFHTDTVVPLVRVQHLDVTRGPFDKMFGTASLVIHTAGTHNSIVALPGLSPDRAAEMRDVIREHVRTDFA
ncbi:MAG TPA: PH domain-containing protein [Sphingomicrobium sp.]